METPKQLAEIRQQIELGKTEEALRLLKQLADQLNHKTLLNEVAALSARYHNVRRDQRTGILDQEDYQIFLAQINKGVLELIQRFESDDLQEPPDIQGREVGRIVHNIPSRMQTLQINLCSVRIAKTDEILLKDFPRSEQSLPESLEISGSMSVDIVDPLGGEVFEVRRITPEADQRIDRSSFTEWDFAIKPKKEGNHVLWLYATTIIDSQRKTLKFFKSIDIQTESVSVSPSWEPTQLLVGQVSDKKLAGGVVHVQEPQSETGSYPSVGDPSPDYQSTRPAPVARPAAKSASVFLPVIKWASALAVALIGGYFAYQYFFSESNNSNPISERANAVIRIAGLNAPDQVTINDSLITDYFFNADKSELMIPDLLVGQSYQFVIMGENGQCNTQAVLKKGKVIMADCQLADVILMAAPQLQFECPSKIFAIQVEGPGVDTTYRLDGTAIRSFTLQPLPNGQTYTLRFRQSDGTMQHTIQVEKGPSVFSINCPPPVPDLTRDLELLIDPELRITLITINGERSGNWIQRESRIIIPDLLIGEAYDITVDGLNGACRSRLTLNKETGTIRMKCKINPAPQKSFEVKVYIPLKESELKIFPKDSRIPITHQLIGTDFKTTLKTGTYRFSVTDKNQRSSCSSQTVRIDKETQIRFSCKLVQTNTSNVRVTVAYNPRAFAGKDLRIINGRQSVKPTKVGRQEVEFQLTLPKNERRDIQLQGKCLTGDVSVAKCKLGTVYPRAEVFTFKSTCLNCFE